jgi:hypothetical protein
VVVLAGAGPEVVDDDDETPVDEVVVSEAVRCFEPSPEQAPAPPAITTSKTAVARPVTPRTAPRP